MNILYIQCSAIILWFILLQKMNVGKDEMEEGEVSSSDGEDQLGEYTPLQVCTSVNILNI